MDLLRKRSLFMNGVSWKCLLTIQKLSLSRINFLQNHYEVLGLNESCSQEEIKEAYVTKSKQLHPDKNPQAPQNHGLIVPVNEAYSVLGKRHSRELYDRELTWQKLKHQQLETDAPFKNVVFPDEYLWQHRDRSQDNPFKNRPYYGIDGVNRLSNIYIAAGVVLFMLVGSFIHFSMANITARHHFRNVSEKNLITSQSYRQARERAIENGNDMQCTLLEENLELRKASKAD